MVRIGSLLLFLGGNVSLAIKLIKVWCVHCIVNHTTHDDYCDDDELC